jgi:predicted transglutaminase-like cysteine proteinase
MMKGTSYVRLTNTIRDWALALIIAIPMAWVGVVGGTYLSTKSFVMVPTRANTIWAMFQRATQDKLEFVKVNTPSPKQKLEAMYAINQWANERIEYASDWDVYGIPEYWATASETLVRERGDCDDFAILKYVILKKMGFTPDELFFTLLYVKPNFFSPDDEGGYHAIVTVRLDGKDYLLDLVDEVKNKEEGYVILWQINEFGMTKVGKDPNGFYNKFRSLLVDLNSGLNVIK